MSDVRKGQAPGHISRIQFHDRFRESFADPLFKPAEDALARVEDIAWKAYSESHKAPLTRKAGPGFADPDYDLSLDWIASRDAIIAAQRRHDEPGPPRILVVAG